MTVYMYQVFTGSIISDRWIVTNEDGGVIGEISENTLGDVPMRISGPGFTPYELPQEEYCGNFETHQKLIAYVIGTDDFNLSVKPVPFGN